MQDEATSALEYPSYIPESRRPQIAPEAIIKDGKSIFGAFDGPISNVNIVDAKKPISPLLPHFMNQKRIKEWEAYEVCFDEGFICGAVYDVGIMVFNVLMFYDRVAKKVVANQVFGVHRKCVGNSLLNNTNTLKTGKFQTAIENRFEDGKVIIKTDYSPKSANKVPMSVDISFESCANPSVTVMPLGKNRPLYTQKELFRAKGKIKIGDREFIMNENSLGIIDDHKGYYPLHMHYDWVTSMGILDGKPVGINLCKNQALDPENHSENCLWMDGILHPLPPVSFEHTKNDEWHVFDKYGAVDLLFETYDSFAVQTKVLMHGVRYIAPFGIINGFVTDVRGNKIFLDGFSAMGEDISFDMI